MGNWFSGIEPIDFLLYICAKLLCMWYGCFEKCIDKGDGY